MERQSVEIRGQHCRTVSCQSIYYTFYILPPRKLSNLSPRWKVVHTDVGGMASITKTIMQEMQMKHDIDIDRTYPKTVDASY